MPPFLLDQLPLVTYKYSEISYYYPEAAKIFMTQTPFCPSSYLTWVERNASVHFVTTYIAWWVSLLTGWYSCNNSYFILSYKRPGPGLHYAYFFIGTSKAKIYLQIFISNLHQILLNKYSFGVRKYLGICLPFQKKRYCDYSEFASCYLVSANCHTEKILFWTWVVPIQINKSANTFWCLRL